MGSKEKIKRGIEVFKYLLKKLHNHIQNNELLINKIAGIEKVSNQDWRVTSFQYQRFIVFCAINDCINFKLNIQQGEFKRVAEELKENFDEELMIYGLRNYPIFNFIVRFQSILETGNKMVISKSQYHTYKASIEENLVTAYNILKTWRNSIHSNGVVNVRELKVFRYRNHNIKVQPNTIFSFKPWILYRIAKDSSDLMLEYYKLSLKDSDDLIYDDYENRLAQE